MSVESHVVPEGSYRRRLDRYQDTGSLPLAAWQLSRVRALLDANLASTIHVKDLAAAARLSVSYFSHAFRSTVGEPPFAYLRRRRVERAQQLILSTEKSLAEIAGECGLADQSHLTKVFRKIVGVTPAAWRRLRGASLQLERSQPVQP
jgi:AraC family transcriptional regulator